METKYKNIGVLVVFCIAAVGLFFFLQKPKPSQKKEMKFPPEKAETKTPPLNLLVFCYRGTSESPSVVSMRVMSRSLTQKKSDRVIKSEKKQEEIVPIQLKVSSGDWINNIKFRVFDKEGNPRTINDKMEMVFSPEKEEIEIGPEDYHEIVFKVASSAFSGGDDYLMAEGKLGSYSVKSNKKEIPPIADSLENRLKDKARNELILGDFETLMKTAQEITKEQPESSSGYWYLGLAEENLGHYKRALSAYQKALERKKPPEETEGMWEPPVLLHLRIREVKKKLDEE